MALITTAWIYGKFYTAFGKYAFDLFEVFKARIAQIIGNKRSILYKRLTAGLLAVKNAKGISLKSGAALVTQLVLALFEILNESFSVFCATFGTADGVDIQAYTADAEALKTFICESDYFTVRLCRSGAEKLNAKLMEFTKSARLRLFIAEARNNVVGFDGQ